MSIFPFFLLRNIFQSLFLAHLLINSVLPTAAPKPDRAIEMVRSGTGSNRIYLPLVIRPDYTDLSIQELEITQAVQTPANSVPLVAGRPTVVRIYPQSNTELPIEGVYVSLSAWRDDALLPDSPLVIGPGSARPTPSRANISNSLNVSLPADWLAGQVRLEATINADGAISEVDMGNNTTSVVMDFNYVPPLEVVVVPINYTHNPDKQLYPAPSADFVNPALMPLYPVSAVNVTVHPAIDYTGDLTKIDHWASLLMQITNLKNTEGAPDYQVYYGLIPVDGTWDNTWFPGGIAGLGWIGTRAALGLAPSQTAQVDGATILAHEIGHNMGRDHAPCGVGNNYDPLYPYSKAKIGQFGFDWNTFQVVPEDSKDVMSYCDPVWVSDYTYQGLYNSQGDVDTLRATPAPRESLLIQATIFPDSPLSLGPVYALSASPTDVPARGEDTSEFVVELADEAGQIVARHPVTAYRAEEPGIQVNAISAIVPQPEQPFNMVRLVQNGEILAERSVNNGSTAKTATLAPTIDQVGDETILRWGMATTPALVRYSGDDGQTWVTLGIDVLGGQLRLDTTAMPEGEVRFEIILGDQVGI